MLVTPVLVFATVTLTLGTTAPVESTATPLIEPVISWALTGSPRQTASDRTATILCTKMTFTKGLLKARLTSPGSLSLMPRYDSIHRNSTGVIPKDDALTT